MDENENAGKKHSVFATSFFSTLSFVCFELRNHVCFNNYNGKLEKIYYFYEFSARAQVCVLIIFLEQKNNKSVFVCHYYHLPLVLKEFVSKTMHIHIKRYFRLIFSIVTN